MFDFSRLKNFFSRKIDMRCDLPDVCDYPQLQRNYNGNASEKMSISVDNEPWMIKFANALPATEKMPTHRFSLHPLTEYIGSSVYSMLGIPAQQTRLFRFGNSICVGCKDFCTGGKQLFEYEKIFQTFQEEHPEIGGFKKHYLDVANLVLDAWKEKIPEAKDTFWDMFVVDILLGNADRHTHNWGFIKNPDNTWEFAPVYDNANIFNVTYSEDRIRLRLENIEDYIFSRISFFCAKNFNGRIENIKSFEFIRMDNSDELRQAILRNVPKFIDKKDEILELINNTPMLPDINKKFYGAVITEEIENDFIPLYNQFSEEVQAPSPF